ncbi:AraC family transcriptional regulator [Legionella taurinensis]|uniref:AraC family transcriptional regulator n=1 Tax=Legionella taurinensis TaxID=70611 RepID=A0A3A5L4L6_9GAMM|nr:GyrI-like domain-containing protein [Legionella taurinensis]MDX1837227.1 GyrI-like domain-containing protein [Legionella taurinensis]PUT40300.1 AraC family transcriptional regulator [Legionella taurinensis]PUT41534.1 AraC family transcriptional regulator [Legionella taurinensis]PUT44400.1 AraC family transcriptional regulator [Legionella taurinensis]PUT48362.1 AraC family transcriptional regulator [Legionella taurinensis]
MKYETRLKKAIAYIGRHLDDDLSLQRLSEVSCISKYHFHRLFTVFTGLSLSQYIKWLRLKRAAHQLIVDKQQSILTIAINAGFQSHEAFTRAFKKACGSSPSQYRLGTGWSHWEEPPYCLPERGLTDMKVDIKTIPRTRLAVVEHRGDPRRVGESVNQLVTWAKAQVINVKPKPGEAFALGYDDPKITPPSEFRLDLGIKVPDSLMLEGVVEKYLPQGRYASAMHYGSRDSIGDTVYALYRDWLPASGEQLGDLPCVFCYYNFDHEVAETELLTECWLLLK